ncbi:MAG: hypothetical protein IJT54_09975, partial [Candidatus Methanomethylophilaceae archaeon]|nr:hypothetical protein [Candidatus Methanomethylophilaceae archaeon]
AAAERKRLCNEREAARIRKMDAKTQARKQNGGAGFSVKFYSITMGNKKARVNRNGKGRRN